MLHLPAELSLPTTEDPLHGHLWVHGVRFRVPGVWGLEGLELEAVAWILPSVLWACLVRCSLML